MRLRMLVNAVVWSPALLALGSGSNRTDGTPSGTPTDLTPQSVAVDFDSAIAAVQPSVDPLPAGAVRDSIQAAQTAVGALRDGLRAGSNVSNTDLNAALDSLSTACDF